MTEPDYRSYQNRNQGGIILDEREKKLRDEWKKWKAKKDKKKPWYM